MNYFTTVCGYIFNNKIFDTSGIYFGVEGENLTFPPAD